MIDRSGRPLHDSRWPGRLALAAAFVVVELLYRHAGVRFDVTPLDEYLQYLDPVLLRTRLLESVYYLHMQPPLFNLFLGLVLKASAAHFAGAFQLIYLGLGLGLSLTLF